MLEAEGGLIKGEAEKKRCPGLKRFGDGGAEEGKKPLLFCLERDIKARCSLANDA